MTSFSADKLPTAYRSTKRRKTAFLKSESSFTPALCMAHSFGDTRYDTARKKKNGIVSASASPSFAANLQCGAWHRPLTTHSLSPLHDRRPGDKVVIGAHPGDYDRIIGNLDI